jgi:nucleoside-diphosphate-sugar epimerase
MKNIIITGGSGFVGSHLAKKLDKKYKILIIDPNSNQELSKYKNIYFYNSNLLKKILLKKKFEFLIHLGAVSHDKDFRKDIFESYKINLNSTINALDLASNLKVKNFIFASTEWVYGDDNKSKFLNERSFVNRDSIISDYAYSKILCEDLIKKSYLRKLIKNYIILRFGIIYGSRTKGCAVEGIFNEIIKKNNVVINGSLNNSKKYLHVEDLTEAIIKSLKIKKPTILNLCNTQLFSIKQIINECKKYTNKKIKFTNINKTYTNTRNVSNAKAKKILRWMPKVSLKKGIKKIFHEIYKKNND